MIELSNLADRCPDGFTCAVETIGFSYEQRELKLFKVNIIYLSGLYMSTGKLQLFSMYVA